MYPNVLKMVPAERQQYTNAQHTRYLDYHKALSLVASPNPVSSFLLHLRTYDVNTKTLPLLAKYFLGPQSGGGGEERAGGDSDAGRVPRLGRSADCCRQVGVDRDKYHPPSLDSYSLFRLYYCVV